MSKLMSKTRSHFRGRACFISAPMRRLLCRCIGHPPPCCSGDMEALGIMEHAAADQVVRHPPQEDGPVRMLLFHPTGVPQHQADHQQHVEHKNRDAPL